MANRYSGRSKRELSTVHKDLQIIFYNVLDIIDNTILYGRRSKEVQNNFYSKGRSFENGVWKTIDRKKVITFKKWPESKHNTLNYSIPSKAVDSAPYINGRMVNGDLKGDREQIYYYAGIVKGIAETLLKQDIITHKIRWGGDWDSDSDVNDQTFNDLMHWEIID